MHQSNSLTMFGFVMLRRHTENRKTTNWAQWVLAKTGVRPYTSNIGFPNPKPKAMYLYSNDGPGARSSFGGSTNHAGEAAGKDDSLQVRVQGIGRGFQSNPPKP